MASRGPLVCVAVLCAALSAAVVAGEAVESHDLLFEASAQGEQGGRMLLTRPVFTPAWVKDGRVYALQGNFVSGNTVQVGGEGDQQANSAAVNNAQINDHSDGNGAVWQQNIKSGRKLLTVTTIPTQPPRTITKDGKVYAFQGNLVSGNTVQFGDKGDQQANSAAVNNAQINKNSDQNGAVVQSNSISKPVIIGGGPFLTSSGRKLQTVTPIPTQPKTITKDGKVYAFQGNLFSGNTLQAGDKGDQQANSAAVNNAQINKKSDGNGAVVQGNSITKTARPVIVPGGGDIPNCSLVTGC